MRIICIVAVLSLATVMANAEGKISEAKTAVGKKKVVSQTVCPVMGGKINKTSFVDYDGKRIYMCCAGCEGLLKKDPAKYIKKLEDAGVTLDKVPVKKAPKKKK